MHASLDDLPDEILHLILHHSEPAQCLALERTCRRFRGITNEPLLWRHYCQSRFQYWDEKHNIEEKLRAPPSTVGWKELYAERYFTDWITTKGLDDILSSQSGRINKAQIIIDHGYDVKDTLLRHARASTDLDDYLARRYYSKAMLGCLQRNIAIPLWANLRENGKNATLERALGSFDLFVPQCGIASFEDIRDMLDTIAENISQQVPDIRSLTPRQRTVSIASYLLTHNYTGIRAGREYHNLEHNFLGLALRDQGHNSLPLISATIYCAIAQRFGLNAQPCGFPFHVLVIILPAVGFDLDGREILDGNPGSPMYMDPWRSDIEVPVADLQRQLNMYGAQMVSQSQFLGKTSMSDIVWRCGKNILNSLQDIPEEPNVLDSESARYAGLWSLMLTTPDSRFNEVRRRLPWFMELFFKEFPWDISLVEQYVISRLRDSTEVDHVSEGLRVMRTVDEMAKTVHPRGPEHQNVKYRVGQVFIHRRYDYQAIITGWDAECDAGEEWVRRMGIDQLQAGRKQSFYHALVEDRSIRYVAEENLQIITPTMSDLSSRLLAIAGKHFKRWDEDERKFLYAPGGRFEFAKCMFHELRAPRHINELQTNNSLDRNSTLFSTTPETYWSHFEEISKYNVHLNVFERLWEAWYAFMQNDVLATGIMSFVMHEVVYFGRSLPWIIIDTFGLFRKYKIQDNKIPTLKEQWECARLVLLSHFTVELPQIWLFHPMAQYFGLTTSVPFPSLWTMAYQIAIFFVMEDTWHYFSHRALHWGPLYKAIHKIHHQYSAPFGLAAEYASPIEVMLLGFGTVGCPIVWCAFTGDLHILTMYIWIVLRLFQAIDAHSGYEFPWSLHHFLPFWAGADHHDVHHEKFIGNFASSFRWWDYVLDTEYTPESVKRWREKKAEKVAKKAN
ncbi:hypothetical protein TMatcc_009908 [Talaromyces marneffei ATCC 18224]|nr:uncharacterized protein EYB26_009130 [Talaromyces marneffei]QGA21420.1 hypothetical protein EYB26_009130 [Talaromyces marneffei]